jgi:Glycine zipper
MRNTLASIALATCTLGVLPAYAGGDGETAAGAALGAVTGALLGHHSGGRDSAIVGGALGGAIGAAIGSEYHRDNVRRVDHRERYYDNDRHYDRGHSNIIVRDHHYSRPPVYVDRRIVIRDYDNCHDGWRGNHRRNDWRDDRHHGRHDNHRRHHRWN